MTTEKPQVSPQILAEAERQYAILSRGVVDIVPKEGLMQKLVYSLQHNKPLNVKFGMDPTAPDIHLGHTVVLQKLRQFQDLGHNVQLLFGDFTTLIGDPSGRNDTRPPLTPEQIQTNAATYNAQAFKVMKPCTPLYNSTWLNKLGFADVIKLLAKVTVSQIMQREDFHNRYTNNTPIAMHEMVYPIMQGYDSVAMDADIELGGTDQTFNCLMGRELQRNFGKPQQVVMTLPLLVGLDGVMKMSKSKNNYVGVTDSPNDMFGKVMSISDTMMPNYYELLLGEDSKKIEADIKSGKLHPMQAKKDLAQRITARFHSDAEAEKAREYFETKFSKRDVPTDLPEIKVSDLNQAWPAFLTDQKFAPSRSEARRLMEAKAVRLEGEVITDVNATLAGLKTPATLEVGKKIIVKLVA
jgi:tyrosyl-tRNA synthetase